MPPTSEKKKKNEVVKKKFLRTKVNQIVKVERKETIPINSD